MLLHAPWGGRAAVEGAQVLDAFAGTGALGLEALSRGAAAVTFMETDKAALTALRANITACQATTQCRVVPMSVVVPPQGQACGLVFLDPPYGQGLVPRALAALATAGWLAPTALVVAEIGREEALQLPGMMVAERAHGAARVTFWRLGGEPAGH